MQMEDNEAEDTMDQGKKRLMPRKADFRMRAHCNPLSDSAFPYPTDPDHVDWSTHYPSFFNMPDEGVLSLNTVEHPVSYDLCTDPTKNGRAGPTVSIADIGCGFGGLLVGLAPIFPSDLILGMEIRDKVTNYVGERIRALRSENAGKYTNISVLRTNSMKSLPNYFRKGQLKKMFFCFPDPHFKKANHRRRIVSVTLLTEYAFFLAIGGRLYTITDVQDLHEWMVEHCNMHPLFRRLTEEELASDPAVGVMFNNTEEGQKVERAQGKKMIAVYERIAG
eukprot:GILJ01004284.1.p1 GENE.GILJ01004284.1~~GILJ01004284.1.p1  ORF type:complete len:299 (-),score=32.87 GILJ01004284.1:131-964(-)